MTEEIDENSNDPTRHGKRSQIIGLIVALLLPFVAAPLGAAKGGA